MFVVDFRVDEKKRGGNYNDINFNYKIVGLMQRITFRFSIDSFHMRCRKRLSLWCGVWKHQQKIYQ